MRIRKQLVLWFLLPAQMVLAQEPVHLSDCQQWARDQHPLLKQKELYRQMSELKLENNQSNYLPKINLNAQATYQSDVTHVSIAMPGINIPTVSKDQYKAYAEFRQSIWDGGISEVNAKLEDAILETNLSQLEVEVYKLNEQVAQTFFTALAMDKQKEVLAAQKKVLEEKLKTVQSGVENQMVEKSAALVLEAEILNLEQTELQLDAGKKTAVQMLSILTGKSIDENSSLKYNLPKLNKQNEFSRPELELFSAQITHLQTQNELLSKSRNPKVFGFGQAGYGRPGLNMLNDKFDSYYLVGVGLSWNAFDWEKTNREKQMLQLQQQMISQQEETFNQNINLLLAQQNEQINKLQKLLETDSKMVSLRMEIAQTSASKLENETITTSDYIQDVQAEGVTQEEIDRAMVKLRSGLYDTVGSSTRIGLVDLLASFALFDNDPGRINNLEKEFDQVTPELIKKTAQEYLRPTNRTVIERLPAGSSEGDEQ